MVLYCLANPIAFFFITASESELDCSTISEYDPDVSRLENEYRVRSLNSSRESMSSQSSYGGDKIIKGRGLVFLF